MNEFRLFAHGEAFDVDAFLESTTLRPDYVWRRGEQRRYSCVESRHPTSGVELVLGNGLTVPFLEQERIAVAYLRAHRAELRALAGLPGVDTFILGLQYRTTFESNVIGFSLGPSVQLMWHCLDVGCEPTYYVTLDRLPEPEVEDAEPGADESKPQALKAQDVLVRMAMAYSGCKSYRDSGVVKTVFVSPLRNWTVEKPFTTAFVRPDRFRFEFKEKEVHGQEYCYIVWRKGKEVQTWWDIEPGVEKPESLCLALSGAAGVSGGSAHTVPALLLPKEVEGQRLIHMTSVKRIDDAKLDKDDCFRIEGKFGGNPTTLWIDQKSFLVRRIDDQHKFDDFRTETTTTYDPAIDEEIPDKKLEFDPPEQK